MLAHEIKNPLAGIKGAAQLLARKTDAGGERFTTLICAEVDRIATLIDQMEHFSRGQPIACGPINLYQPIHQAMETARARQFSRSEEHTSELQSLMRISYAVFCLKKKTKNIQ